MKAPSLVLASLLGASAAHAAPASRLPSEWFVPGDTSDKEFALVDQATGTVRLGFMSSDGSFSWLHTVPTGIGEVSDVAVSTFSNGEALALTSRSANRVSIVPLDASLPVARTLSPASGIGFSGLGEVKTSTHPELLFSSLDNGGSSTGRFEIVNTPLAPSSSLASTASSLTADRLEPLANPGGTVFSFFQSYNGSQTRVGIAQRSSASVNASTKVILTGEFHFVTEVTGSSGSRLAVGFLAGSDAARLITVSTPVSTSSTFTSASSTFPFPVGGLLPLIRGGVGPMTDGLLALSADGSQAAWLRINAAGTGFLPVTQTFTPDTPGTALTGLLPLASIGIVKLSGPSANGPSTTFTAQTWNGSSWDTTASGQVPVASGAARNFATLLFYDTNPVTSETARLLGLQDAPDWTRRTSPSDPLPASVLRETFTTPSSGLSSSTSQAVSSPPGTGYVMTNQVSDSLSISALNRADALFAPDLTVQPASGSFAESFQVTASFDSDRYDLRWRQEPSGSWQTWSGPLPVAYTTQLQFSLRHKATGTLGPIERRSYQFDPSSLAARDSDGDGIPDYVEIGLGLDPFAGADSDGDSVSDLAEILAGTDPGDPGDSPVSPSSPTLGNGFAVVTDARHSSGADTALGETLSAFLLDGSLLDSEAVASLSPALADGTARGATLSSGTSIPRDESVTLASPLYFNLTSGGRLGREMFRMIPADPPVPFQPSSTPTGANLGADTANWIAAAQAAAAAYKPVAQVTRIEPADTAVCVLAEALLHSALATCRPGDNPAPALDSFTALAQRPGDRSRSRLDEADLELLRASGYSHRLAIQLAGTARGSFVTLANAVYQRHATQSESSPGMPMPFDALRTALRTGALPADYAGIVSPAQLAAAVTAYQNVLSSHAQTFRPYTTWIVEIPAVSPGLATYVRRPDGAQVVLLRAGGDRFTLEQGLGLRPGTRFSVSGFTDTAPIHSLATMEVTSVAVALIPASSDRDTDGNLLDDEWELFFFGAIGQDPGAIPGPGSHTLLQFFLDGTDPRGGIAPSSTPVAILPSSPFISPGPSGSFTIDFSFPSAYADRFDIRVESSTTLNGLDFTEVSTASISPTGPDRFRAVIPAGAAAAPRCFYRIAVRLP